MLVAVSQNSPSPDLTLGKGETAELKFCSFSPVGIGNGPVQVIVTAESQTFSMFPHATLSGTVSGGYALNPIKIVGPATVKLILQGNHGPQFATFDVVRVGTASGPVPIPQEAGTTWQVILEASSDLVNWTAVQPGDYPSSTPQKYFRTRLVRKP